MCSNLRMRVEQELKGFRNEENAAPVVIDKSKPDIEHSNTVRFVKEVAEGVVNEMVIPLRRYDTAAVSQLTSKLDTASRSIAALKEREREQAALVDILQRQLKEACEAKEKASRTAERKER